MIIRCERCSTLYELEESLLAPGGSDVQCTRCQHIFRARPPRAPGHDVQGAPASDPAPPAPEAPPSPAPPAPTAAAAAPAPSAQPAATSAGRQPPRHGPAPAVYRPPISQPSASRASLIRRDAVGTFETRVRRSHRWRWLAPALFAAVLGLGVVAFLLRESLVDPRAHEAHQKAVELMYRDDLVSLQQARARLDDAIRGAPRLYAAQADRALVDVLLAGALSQAAQDRGGAAAEVSGLVEQARAALEQLERTHAASAEVARVRAVAASLGTDRAEVTRLATAARSELPDDPLVQVAEQSVETRSGDKVARERAMSALALLVARRPDVIRARYVLSRAQALSGRRAEALATLEALLKANPRHEGALALRETLARPVAPAGAPASAPIPAPAIPSQAAGARPEKPATPQRKADSTSGEDAAASEGGGAARGAPLAPPARAKPKPGDDGAAGGAPDGTEAVPERAPGDGDPLPAAPRLRPAAVPEPEPVQGGG